MINWYVLQFPQEQIRNKDERGRFIGGSSLYVVFPNGVGINSLAFSVPCFFSIVWACAVSFSKF